MSQLYQVRIKWGDYGEGVSDLIVTHCCSPTPCYFVEFPDGYAGYFYKWDVIELRGSNGVILEASWAKVGCTH